MGISIRTRLLSLAILIILTTLGNSESIDDEVPMTKLTQNVGAPTLKFFYW